jgi:hypothetical protein
MYKAIFWSGVAVNAGLSIFVGLSYAQKNALSKQAITSRQVAAENLAKHVNSETCLVTNQQNFFKIGDPVLVKGSHTGKLATSCIYAKKHKQYLEVAYNDQELQVIRIFSVKEIKSALSVIKEENKQ